MKELQLNRIAIWSPKSLDEFSVRESPAGRPTSLNGLITLTTAKTYRYAKNYTKGNLRYCLFFVTYDNAPKDAEEFLDATAKKVTKEQIQKALTIATTGDFDYLNIIYKETK